MTNRAKATLLHAETHCSGYAAYILRSLREKGWYHPDYYDFDKDTCDRCGISKVEAKKHPVETGVNHPEYRFSTSFSLGSRGQVHCAKCNREMELESLFATMDKRDAAKEVR
jgi:hypothetical protein